MLAKYTAATESAKETPPPPVEYGLEPAGALAFAFLMTGGASPPERGVAPEDATESWPSSGDFSAARAGSTGFSMQSPVDLVLIGQHDDRSDPYRRCRLAFLVPPRPVAGAIVSASRMVLAGLGTGQRRGSLLESLIKAITGPARALSL